MAHVLLPSDLPSWPDVQFLLSQLSECTDGRQVVQIMTDIYNVCCVSLDPDDTVQKNAGHPGLSELGRYLDETLTQEERAPILSDTIPGIAARAAGLKSLKPISGFLYSLRKEENTFQLDREFVASLLANAFFSTFPGRNSRTHPTLQDFRMAAFFLNLNKRSHQKKLRAFLRYFDNLEPHTRGHVKFTRKVLNGPSLPGWLCSDRPLVPLVLRPEDSSRHTESQVYRACSCPPSIGGDALKASASKEAKLFFTFPELLVILSFVESLTDGEALIAEALPHHPKQGVPAGFCFLESVRFLEGDSGRQFEDGFLLRELNKALSAFSHQSLSTEDLQPSEVQRTHLKKPYLPSESLQNSGTGETHRILLKKLQKKFSSQNSSRLSSMRTASQTSVDPPPADDDYYTADEDSDGDRSSGREEESASVSRSDSVGFVLGEESDSSLPQHERLEDFRKRIRKRTRRRLSRRSSRSSYAGSSSGSSDMDDISEDPEELLTQNSRPRVIRSANSEPSLVTALDESVCAQAPLSLAAETALLTFRGKKVLVISSNGHLKAYSYDGVSPNLPVPFRAKFRRRRHHSEEGERSVELEELSKQGNSLDEPTSTGWSRDKTPQERDVHLATMASITPVPHRRLPVVVDGGSGSGEEGDCQLKMTILWLAASMAQLQAVILYAADQPQLQEVYGRVLDRQWTVGDLSCEVLRFCRNKLFPRRRASDHLFEQLIGRRSPSLD